MAARAQRAVRTFGWVGMAILAACLALTVTAPPSAASDVRADPSGRTDRSLRTRRHEHLRHWATSRSGCYELTLPKQAAGGVMRARPDSWEASSW